MALMDENGTGTTMLVQPAGFGGNGGGNGFMDGSGGWWILLLFILLGGWGNNNGVGGGFGGGMGGLYPWMNQSNQISEGFPEPDAERQHHRHPEQPERHQHTAL